MIRVALVIGIGGVALVGLHACTIVADSGPGLASGAIGPSSANESSSSADDDRGTTSAQDDTTGDEGVMTTSDATTTADTSSGGTFEVLDDTTNGDDSGAADDGTSGAPPDEQPPSGAWSSCDADTPCMAPYSCLAAEAPPNAGVCTLACDGGDPNSCPAAPGGTTTPICVAVSAQSVCALDCIAGQSCPVGMECTAEMDAVGAVAICL